MVTGTGAPVVSRAGSKAYLCAAATAAPSNGSPAPSNRATRSTLPSAETSIWSTTVTSGAGKTVPSGSSGGTSWRRRGGVASSGPEGAGSSARAGTAATSAIPAKGNAIPAPGSASTRARAHPRARGVIPSTCFCGARELLLLQDKHGSIGRAHHHGRAQRQVRGQAGVLLDRGEAHHVGA